jgi:hypothetical protein
VADVDRDPLGQAKLKLAGRQYFAGPALQPCKGLSQVHAGVVLGGLRPQGTGNGGPSDHPAVKRQKRNESLRRPRNAEQSISPEQTEPAEQHNHELAIGIR